MNIILILIATIIQFVLGALWYSPILFGKEWMKIMEAGRYSEEEMAKMRKSMTPFYLLQFLLTLVFTTVLAVDIFYAQVLNLGLTGFGIAGGVWLGFIVPTQISGVIWGRTDKKHWGKQILIMISYQFVGILFAAWILSM